jgi:hypothetical protein
MTVPYAWVWIPNPPSGPPGSSEQAPARHSEVYRWTDEQGVMHMTDRLEAVPLQHRPPPKQPS